MRWSEGMRFIVSMVVAAICHTALFMVSITRVEEVPPQLGGSRHVCLTFSASHPATKITESTDDQKEPIEKVKTEEPEIPQVVAEIPSLPEKPQKRVDRITPRDTKKIITRQVAEQLPPKKKHEEQAEKDPAPQKSSVVQDRPVAETRPASSSSASASLGKEVEVKASPLYRQNKQPEYPSLARRRGWQGRVIVAVEVLKNGAVGNVRIQKSSGYQILDESALETISNWLFQPGKRKGQPATMEIVVPIRFTLHGE